MANKVYLFNDNDYPLREIFKGNEVTIGAKDFWRTHGGQKKEIDIFEANDFRGQYHPIEFDGSGKIVNDPKNYKIIKMIPVEGDTIVAEDIPTFKCMARDCKHVSPSPEELEAHTKTRHPNIETLIMPEVESDIKKKKVATK